MSTWSDLLNYSNTEQLTKLLAYRGAETIRAAGVGDQGLWK